MGHGRTHVFTMRQKPKMPNNWPGRWLAPPNEQTDRQSMLTYNWCEVRQGPSTLKAFQSLAVCRDREASGHAHAATRRRVFSARSLEFQPQISDVADCQTRRCIRRTIKRRDTRKKKPPSKIHQNPAPTFPHYEFQFIEFEGGRERERERKRERKGERVCYTTSASICVSEGK